MDIILSRIEWTSALVYLHDVIIFSRFIGEPFTHVKAVLRLLQQASVTLKLKKCFFVKPPVDYLDRVLLRGKIQMANATTKAIRDAKPSRTETEAHFLLVLCDVYRRFVPGFAKVAAPHAGMLKKRTPSQFFDLLEEQFGAYRNLTDHLVSPPIFALPRANKPCILDTDASATQVGCALLQEQDSLKDYRPIGYWSRSITKAERD